MTTEDSLEHFLEEAEFLTARFPLFHKLNHSHVITKKSFSCFFRFVFIALELLLVYCHISIRAVELHQRSYSLVYIQLFTGKQDLEALPFVQHV